MTEQEILTKKEVKDLYENRDWNELKKQDREERAALWNIWRCQQSISSDVALHTDFPCLTEQEMKRIGVDVL